jgi:gamma-glutamyltranspeptidase/glutathione hydrolase
VAEPVFTSLGGGGFCLARTAEGEAVLFDFFVDTPGRGAPAGALEPHFVPVTVRFPAADQVFNAGLGSVAVPGVLAGLLHVHRRLGRRPLAEVVAPAVALARGGVEVSPFQSYALGLLLPILSLTEESRRLYVPGGRARAPGTRLRNPELADFLETLPEGGGRRFYEGDLARRVAEDMRAGRGLLTEADLAAYAEAGVVERAPLAWEYGGHRFLGNPPPSRGASLVAFGLERLAPFGLAHLAPGGPEHALALAEVLEAMEAHRATPGGRIASRGTTHVSVADAEGNVASMTTSNGEASGYVVPGTGILLNNMLGEDDLHPDGFHASPPGERVASMMTPTLVLSEPDAVRLVLGSGGSKRIRTAILQVASAAIDFGAGVREAVEAPRLHWDGALLQVEPGLAPAALEALRARWPVNPWPERNLYFGGAHAVAPGEGAAGDPRRGGAAEIVA